MTNPLIVGDDSCQSATVLASALSPIHEPQPTDQQQNETSDEDFAAHALDSRISTNGAHASSYMEISTNESNGLHQQRRQQSRRRHVHSLLSTYRSSASWLDKILSPEVTFWMLGLLNNSSFVIMIACAKEISEGGTALVYLANVLPSLSIKLSAAFWFDKVTYTTRMAVATIFMMGSFILIATLLQYQRNGVSSSLLSSSTILFGQLLGVALTSAQGGLGEASLLALAGKFDSGDVPNPPATMENVIQTAQETSSRTSTSVREGTDDPNSGSNNHQSKGQCLTCYSSGTGLAGLFGFFWKWFLNEFLGWSLPLTLFLAVSLAIMYWVSFRCLQVNARHPTTDETHEPEMAIDENQALTSAARSPPLRMPRDEGQGKNEEANAAVIEETIYPAHAVEIPYMTAVQRIKLAASLWPYMTPLFVVYAAEYALQSGTWSAIGFPTVHDKSARDHFYEFGNWMYQAGVFVSRSSGALFTAPMWLLWLMPALQVCNVVIFWFVGASSPDPVDVTSSMSTFDSPVLDFMYQPAVLYPICFYVGLLGGAVFVSGNLRICADLPLAHREFAISTTTCADGLGIVLADLIGLFLQSCLYQIHGLEGAVVKCPMKMKQQ